MIGPEVKGANGRFADLLAQPHPLVMGILNVTPDSFSDGGDFVALEKALQHARSMIEEGAAIIDVGGESTRPGAAPVSAEDEIARVAPVIRALAAEAGALVSIDTSKPAVMRAAVAAGAGMINDVRALREPGALEAAAELGLPVCLMHLQGEPRTMQQAPHYDDVVAEVAGFLRDRIQACEAADIPRRRLLVDPGFGFGKRLEHNLSLLKHLGRFADLDAPLLVGISRKSMLGRILGDAPLAQRLHASVAAALLAAQRGARILRVHDVGPTVQALKVLDAVNNAP